MRGLGGSWGLGPDLMFSGKEKVLLGILYIVQSLRISLQSGVLGSQLLTWFTFFPSAPYWKKSTELLIISFFACHNHLIIIILQVLLFLHSGRRLSFLFVQSIVLLYRSLMMFFGNQAWCAGVPVRSNAVVCGIHNVHESLLPQKQRGVYDIWNPS